VEPQGHEGVIRDAMESLRVRSSGRSEQELRRILDAELAKLSARRGQEGLREAVTEVRADAVSPKHAGPDAAQYQDLGGRVKAGGDA
jgi:hypothetical protein